MLDGMPTKTALRAEMRAVRRRITANGGDRAARSARMWTAATSLLPAPGRIMLFESRPSEPDTAGWFDWCRSSGWHAFVPSVDGPDLRVQPGDLDPAALDVIVVPGLAFTRAGRRLGQGGGHYDRFLARLATPTLTIGVCFAEQLLDDLPTEPHDVPVDRVVTDAD